MKYILAHDLGTSGDKATLYTMEGDLVKSVTYGYDTIYLNNNWAEQNPDDWWNAVCVTTRQLLKNADIDDIAVVSFSAQMMGCLCVDKNGVPLRNSILYCDQRAIKEAASIIEYIDPYEFYKITGHRASSVYSIEKLMWVKNNQHDIFKNTYKMLNAKDYIVFKLTGEMVTDYSDASGTNAFDIVANDWSHKLLDIMQIDVDILPQVYPSTHVAGEVTKFAAEETGLKKGTLVVIGAGDGSAAGVGAGSIKPDKNYVYVGSSAWVATTVKEPLYDKKMRTMTWAHAVPGYYHPSGSMQAAGTSLNWAKNELYQYEAENAKKQGVDEYMIIDREIEKSPPGSNGVIFLPYLLGERSPHWNPNAKGTFLGLKVTNKKADMLRAVMEGVVFNLNIILDVFRQFITVEEMTILGGGAVSDVWRQIFADIFGVSIKKPDYIAECTSMGAAVIGGVGIGAFKNFEAIYKFIKLVDKNEPVLERNMIYKKNYDAFIEAYHSLVNVFELLS
ncbi:MAG: xylulokinase [Eubacteriales bacterium]|nr:xylulokinase [Eubacteriales bacterium]